MLRNLIWRISIIPSHFKYQNKLYALCKCPVQMPCANALYPWINRKRKPSLLHSMISSQHLIQSLHLSMAFAYLSCVLFFFYLYLNKFFLHDFRTWWYRQYFSVNISFTEVQFSKSLLQVTCQRFPRCGSVKFKVCLNCLPPNFRLKFSLTLLLHILLPLTPLELQGNLALNWKKINRI